MTRQHLKSLSAAIALLAIVAGVPLLLYALGGALPSEVPSAHQTMAFLGRPLANNDLLRGLSLICWAAWALFVIAVAAEALAWIQHRPGPSLTRQGLRIPGLQGAASSLFLAAVLLLPHKSTATGLTLATSMSSAASISAVNSQLPISAELQTVGPNRTAQQADNRVPYVIDRGETLWGIAEAHTGNGLAWRQITDVHGRSFDTGIDEWVQVNGRMIYERGARIIYPGETVLLPASWASSSTAPASQPVKDRPDSTPEPRVDNAIGAPAEPQQVAPVEPSTTTSPSWVIDHGGHTTNAIANGTHHDNPVGVVGLIGAGILAGAVLSTLGRLRARQSRHRRPGRRIRLPHADLATAELELRSADRSDLISATHKTLHALTADLLEQGPPRPVICAVIASEDRIEVLLDRPGRLPSRWEASDDGYRWSLAVERIPPEVGNRTEPVPCLIPIGRIPGSDAEVMINLAAAGVLCVRGDSERSAGLFHAAAFAFAGLPWASSADVLLIGSQELPAEAAVQMQAVPSLDDVIDRLEAQIVELRKALGDCSNSGIDRPEGWLPTVVLLPHSASSETLARLVSLCTEGPGICAMLASASSSPGWTLDVDSDPAIIPQLRLALEPLSPPPELVKSIRQLVTLAADNTDISVTDPPYDQLQSGQRKVVSTPAPPEVECAGALDSEGGTPARINILGPVTFDGVDNFLRPRSFEIALYLALHPDGVTESRLDEMIWPSKTEVLRSTRDQAVSAARTALGGRARFPLANGQGRDKTYRLTPQVSTDWSEFCTLYRQGRQENSVEPLRAALELIRGRPFGDLDAGPGFRWLHVEGHIHHMEAEIADAADLAASLYLERAQPLDARWAATQGLLAGPYTERLWVRLMTAADALGEAQEVERLLAEMDRRLGLEGDFSQLHPDTIAAYRRCSHQRASPRP